MRLRDQAAIVTGGAQGIGAAICRRFAAEGAAVLVVDQQPEAGEGEQQKEPGEEQQSESDQPQPSQGEAGQESEAEAQPSQSESSQQSTGADQGVTSGGSGGSEAAADADLGRSPGRRQADDRVGCHRSAATDRLCDSGSWTVSPFYRS